MADADPQRELIAEQEIALPADVAPAKPKRSRARKSDVATADAAPKAPRQRRGKAAAKASADEVAAVETGSAEQEQGPASDVEPAPAIVPDVVAKAEPVLKAPVAEPETSEPVVEVADPNKPKRSGWWARAKQVIGGE